MPIERQPANPLPSNYVPAGAKPYKVKTGDSWVTVAHQLGMDVWDLIAFNFKTRVPEEVNWYLKRNVGCTRPTADGYNWTFSSDARPGIIYLPAGGTSTPQVLVMPEMVIEGKRPSGIWFGLGGGGGGHLAIYGRETKEFWVYSVDHYHDNFLLGTEGERWGPGLGGSAAVNIVIITSLWDPYKLNGMDLSWQWDFQLNMAGKWGDFLKVLGKSGKYARVVKILEKIGQVLGKEILQGAKGGIKLSATSWEILATKVKELVVSGFNTKAAIPQVSAFEVPLLGTGAEVSLFKVKSKLRVDAVNRYNPGQ